jgi:hypothetical protein
MLAFWDAGSSQLAIQCISTAIIHGTINLSDYNKLWLIGSYDLHISETSTLLVAKL